MKKCLFSLFAFLLVSTSVMAYDADRAAGFDAFYSHLTQEQCANSTLFVDGEGVMKMIRDGVGHLLLDVRSQGEASVVALSAPGALHVPIEHLFEKANLDRLPTDRPIIIVCHSGTRATMAAMALKQLGFKQAQVLKGGIVALANADNPKNAPLK